MCVLILGGIDKYFFGSIKSQRFLHYFETNAQIFSFIFSEILHCKVERRRIFFAHFNQSLNVARIFRINKSFQ